MKMNNTGNNNLSGNNYSTNVNDYNTQITNDGGGGEDDDDQSSQLSNMTYTTFITEKVIQMAITIQILAIADKIKMILLSGGSKGGRGSCYTLLQRSFYFLKM